MPYLHQLAKMDDKNDIIFKLPWEIINCGGDGVLCCEPDPVNKGRYVLPPLRAALQLEEIHSPSRVSVLSKKLTAK